MELFIALFQALKDSASVAMLAITLIALAWFVRDARRRDEEHAKQLQALNDAQRAALEAHFKDHLETALQVAPLASKLVTCVEVLERLSNRVTGG